MEQKKQFSDDHMFRKKPNAFLVKKLSAPSKKGRAESGKQPSNPSTVRIALDCRKKIR